MPQRKNRATPVVVDGNGALLLDRKQAAARCNISVGLLDKLRFVADIAASGKRTFGH